MAAAAASQKTAEPAAGAQTVWTTANFAAQAPRASDNVKSGVFRSIVLDAPIDACWALARRFTSTMTPPPPGGVLIYPADPSHGELIIAGQNRIIDIVPIKKKLLERLDTISDLDHTLTYTIIAGDAGAFPCELYNYRATLSFYPVTEGGKTFATWKADYECSAARVSDVQTAVGDQIFIGSLKALNAHLNPPAKK